MQGKRFVDKLEMCMFLSYYKFTTRQIYILKTEKTNKQTDLSLGSHFEETNLGSLNIILRMLTNVDDNKMGISQFRMRSFTDIPSRKGIGLHILNITHWEKILVTRKADKFQAEVSYFSLGLSI
jgi:hypothetical protein